MSDFRAIRSLVEMVEMHVTMVGNLGERNVENHSATNGQFKRMRLPEFLRSSDPIEEDA